MQIKNLNNNYIHLLGNITSRSTINIGNLFTNTADPNLAANSIPSFSGNTNVSVTIDYMNILQNAAITPYISVSGSNTTCSLNIKYGLIAIGTNQSSMIQTTNNAILYFSGDYIRTFNIGNIPNTLFEVDQSTLEIAGSYNHPGDSIISITNPSNVTIKSSKLVSSGLCIRSTINNTVYVTSSIANNNFEPTVTIVPLGALYVDPLIS